MSTIIGLDGQEKEVIDLTPKTDITFDYDRKPYQNIIEEEPPKEIYKPIVYASMQHSYPPVKIFDMNEVEINDSSYFLPKLYQPDFFDSRYRGTSLISFNFLIDELTTLYFRNVGNVLTLLGPDKKDETALRIYGTHSSRKTFIVLLREALHEYAGIDTKVLYTKIGWLKNEGMIPDNNKGPMKTLRKYRFVPNWIDWITGSSDITEDKVILPFIAIYDQQTAMYFHNSSRFEQSAVNQTFYTYLTGESVIGYACEYPFLYSIGPDGEFTDASAIFELKDPKFFEMVFARVIANYVKRSLDMIQLPGNVANFNFDNMIQELNDKIQGYTNIAAAETVSGFWNAHNPTKF